MDQQSNNSDRHTTPRSLGANYFRLLTAFAATQEVLKTKKFTDRLDKPLAYWTTPADRRLPQAFLGKSLGTILDTPFADLCETPGIGQKKMMSLIKLLQRAAKEEPTNGFLTATDSTSEGAAEPTVKLDLSTVSEVQWAQWRETIQKHRLEKHSLGQLVPTLQSLPTVLWNVLLATYMGYALAEIRQLKTHGEKRVRVVLEVVYDLHRAFASVEPRENWALRLAPTRIALADDWISEMLSQNRLPALTEICDSFVQPLLDQLLIDLGPDVHALAEGRLGLCGPTHQVGLQAKRMGVTRARVYQLLEDCRKALTARWPQGECRVAALVDGLCQGGASGRELALLREIRSLFFTGLGDSECGEA